jgi:hypothetical protein
LMSLSPCRNPKSHTRPARWQREKSQPALQIIQSQPVTSRLSPLSAHNKLSYNLLRLLQLID